MHNLNIKQIMGYANIALAFLGVALTVWTPNPHTADIIAIAVAALTGIAHASTPSTPQPVAPVALPVAVIEPVNGNGGTDGV